MRTSNFLLATLRELPSEAEVISHKLMLRAGMIRMLASGIYTWLPIGLRVLKKVENIVREEMNLSGALEILMPSIQPSELWRETGRWDYYGNELLKINDRHGREFCFGPTHEEVITYLVRSEVRSYKQLPLNLYQIQNKFRDEIRPRFGVMRSREFLMKDSYSFHIDNDSLEETYNKMYETYVRIFDRIGLDFRVVLADTGNIGGNMSHEFHVIANSGEDLIAFSDESDYAANIDKAEALYESVGIKESNIPMEVIDTPGKHTISEVCDFLDVMPNQTVKTLIVKGVDDPFVALLIRGDHELNNLKAIKLPQIAEPLTFIDSKELQEVVGCSGGFYGPVGLKMPIIADRDVVSMENFVCGANEDDKHLKNVNWNRDLPIPIVEDIRKVVEGDVSPDGKGKLRFARGIEVGHIFQVGSKYSKAMKATVMDDSGKSVPLIMGCYGIGISRIVAAAIEQNNDDKGIIWSDSIAPFQIVIIPMSFHKSYRVKEVSENMYKLLSDEGFDVLLDDRKERAGVLFSDADLIGIPHRIVISESGLDDGMLEYKSRHSQDSEKIALKDVADILSKKIK